MTDIFESPVKKGDKIIYTKLILVTGEIEDIRKAFDEEVAVIGNTYLKPSDILLYDRNKHEREEK